MNTFTKEQLIEQAKKNIEVLRGAVEKIPGASDAAVIHLKLARIALASLEAEKCADPVAFINGAWTLVYYRPPKELGLKVGDKLYTAPPAPVSVPDDLYKIANHIASAKGFLPNEWQDWAEEIEKDIRRAAMLQGAKPVTTANKLPEGYVLVPVELTGAMTNAMTDAILDDLHNVDVWRSVLAAAPQQEA
ncbi:hypothetical protein L8Q47_15065 [Enterobacter bugandensis]|uniref:hypothetical protein n=1 Tax=Enterobacter bugandensis TaxID=881260 RepID=UPI0020067BAA|nr:hypothetical protein [Enterobacter bugandensis]MCK6946324.1 hypothetical protein [Enterobacter bugandensis]